MVVSLIFINVLSLHFPHVVTYIHVGLGCVGQSCVGLLSLLLVVAEVAVAALDF